MIRPAAIRSAFIVVVCATSASPLAHARDDTSEAREIPPAFAPLEYLIGHWKGQGMPKEKALSNSAAGPKNTPGRGSSPRANPAGLSFTDQKGTRSSLPAR